MSEEVEIKQARVWTTAFPQTQHRVVRIDLGSGDYPVSSLTAKHASVGTDDNGNVVSVTLIVSPEDSVDAGTDRPRRRGRPKL